MSFPRGKLYAKKGNYLLMGIHVRKDFLKIGNVCWFKTIVNEF